MHFSPWLKDLYQVKNYAIFTAKELKMTTDSEASCPIYMLGKAFTPSGSNPDGSVSLNTETHRNPPKRTETHRNGDIIFPIRLQLHDELDLLLRTSDKSNHVLLKWVGVDWDNDQSSHQFSSCIVYTILYIYI